MADVALLSCSYSLLDSIPLPTIITLAHPHCNISPQVRYLANDIAQANHLINYISFHIHHALLVGTATSATTNHASPNVRRLPPSINNLELFLFYYVDPVDTYSTYHGYDPIYGHEMWDARPSTEIDEAFATYPIGPDQDLMDPMLAPLYAETVLSAGATAPMIMEPAPYARPFMYSAGCAGVFTQPSFPSYPPIGTPPAARRPLSGYFPRTPYAPSGSGTPSAGRTLSSQFPTPGAARVPSAMRAPSSNSHTMRSTSYQTQTSYPAHASQRPKTSVLQPATANQAHTRPPSYFHQQHPSSGQTPAVMQRQGSYRGGSPWQARNARSASFARATRQQAPATYIPSGLSLRYRTIYDVDDEVEQLERRLAELKAVQASVSRAPQQDDDVQADEQPEASSEEPVTQPKLSTKGKQRAESPPRPAPTVEDEQVDHAIEHSDSVDPSVIGEPAAENAPGAESME